MTRLGLWETFTAEVFDLWFGLTMIHTLTRNTTSTSTGTMTQEKTSETSSIHSTMTNLRMREHIRRVSLTTSWQRPAARRMAHVRNHRLWFFEHPWFRRTWLYQEFVLAPRTNFPVSHFEFREDDIERDFKFGWISSTSWFRIAAGEKFGFDPCPNFRYDKARLSGVELGKAKALKKTDNQESSQVVLSVESWHRHCFIPYMQRQLSRYVVQFVRADELHLTFFPRRCAIRLPLNRIKGSSGIIDFARDSLHSNS
jgi:hypothetical protein